MRRAMDSSMLHRMLKPATFALLRQSFAQSAQGSAKARANSRGHPDVRGPPKKLRNGLIASQLLPAVVAGIEMAGEREPV
jgi:hypothetical protein